MTSAEELFENYWRFKSEAWLIGFTFRRAPWLLEKENEYRNIKKICRTCC